MDGEKTKTTSTGKTCEILSNHKHSDNLIWRLSSANKPVSQNSKDWTDGCLSVFTSYHFGFSCWCCCCCCCCCRCCHRFGDPSSCSILLIKFLFWSTHIYKTYNIILYIWINYFLFKWMKKHREMRTKWKWRKRRRRRRKNKSPTQWSFRLLFLRVFVLLLIKQTNSHTHIHIQRTRIRCDNTQH